MVNIINQDYGFDLPTAVVKKSLRKLEFLDRNQSSYTIKQEVPFNADKVREITKNEITENQKIIDYLCEYVESKSGETLSVAEKSKLCNDFCAFIIDDTKATNYRITEELKNTRNRSLTDYTCDLDQAKKMLGCK